MPVQTEFTTSKGTTLPILNLRGKPYLQVAHRLVWFREEHPTAVLKTQMIADLNDEAIFRAEVYIPDANGTPQLAATAHKAECKKDFPDYREKAETGSIGRVLALVGFGTQFTSDELDEGNRLADSPIMPAKKAPASFRPVKATVVGNDI